MAMPPRIASFQQGYSKRQNNCDKIKATYHTIEVDNIGENKYNVAELF